MTSSHPVVLRAASLFVLLGACSNSSQYLDLHLVADPHLVSEQDLAQRLSHIHVTLDDPENGLYPPARQDWGQLVVDDFDHDGQGELRADYVVDGHSELPAIRIEQGGLPDSVRLDIDIQGIQRDNAEIIEIASGEIRDVNWDMGKIDVLFNLLPEYLPPRIERVEPQDDTVMLQDRDPVVEVAVVFTKVMNVVSLRSGALTAIRLGENGEEVVPWDTLETDTIPGQSEFNVLPKTIARYTFAERLVPGHYRVVVSPDAMDESGNALDQSPLQEGLQPFESSFDVTAPEQPIQGDFLPLPCDEGGTLCPAPLQCNTETQRCEFGACPAVCPDAMLCNESLNTCVVDCRRYGDLNICSGGAICQPDGLCR